MSSFGIDITAKVDPIYKYEGGRLLCTDGNGCVVTDADTGKEIARFTSSLDLPYTPPEGVVNVAVGPIPLAA